MKVYVVLQHFMIGQSSVRGVFTEWPDALAYASALDAEVVGGTWFTTQVSTLTKKKED